MKYRNKNRNKNKKTKTGPHNSHWRSLQYVFENVFILFHVCKMTLNFISLRDLKNLLLQLITIHNLVNSSNAFSASIQCKIALVAQTISKKILPAFNSNNYIGIIFIRIFLSIIRNIIWFHCLSVPSYFMALRRLILLHYF